MAGGARDFVVSIILRASDLASPILGGASKEAQELGGAVSKLGPSAQAAGAAMSVAGGAIVGSLVASAKAATEYGGQLIDMSARTGASVEALQELGYAAQQTGADMGAVETGLKFVSRAAVDAANGSEAQAAAFERLGVSVTDASGQIRPAQELMTDVGNALRNVGSDAERTDLAVQMFGRSGTALIPMFTDAGMSLDQFREQARSLGLVMSEDTAARMDDAGDKIDASMARIKMAGTGMGAAVAPVLADVAEDIAKVVGHVTAWAQKNPELAEGMGKVALAGGGLMTVVGPMLMALPSLSAGWNMVAGALSATNIAAKANMLAGWAKGAYAAAAAGYAWATANVAAAASLVPLLVPIGLVVAALSALLLVARDVKVVLETIALNRRAKETDKQTQEMAASRGWTVDKDGTIHKPEGRAVGGPVTGGEMYLVGERGPELWVAPKNGSIVPADQTAAMMSRARLDASPLVMRAGETAMAQERAAADRKAEGAARGKGGDTYTINVHGPALGDSGLRRLIGDVVREVLEGQKYTGMALGTA